MCCKAACPVATCAWMPATRSHLLEQMEFPLLRSPQFQRIRLPLHAIPEYPFPCTRTAWTESLSQTMACVEDELWRHQATPNSAALDPWPRNQRSEHSSTPIPRYDFSTPLSLRRRQETQTQENHRLGLAPSSRHQARFQAHAQVHGFRYIRQQICPLIQVASPIARRVFAA